MNPDHYQLAKEECEQLVSQGIIEPTTSLCASDDKFPLPQKKSLFQHLVDAKVLSKSSLPMESNAVWFKNAPLAFQKAMITIFEPILANILVYIDDILLFSLDEQSHGALSSESQRRAGISPQPRQQPTKHEVSPTHCRQRITFIVLFSSHQVWDYVIREVNGSWSDYNLVPWHGNL
ncbi:hypothetical protein Tco_1106767 [Tanacetum coccineum]